MLWLSRDMVRLSKQECGGERDDDEVEKCLGEGREAGLRTPDYEPLFCSGEAEGFVEPVVPQPQPRHHRLRFRFPRDRPGQQLFRADFAQELHSVRRGRVRRHDQP